MIRVLFVDDEPQVLEGLENRLRVMRQSWKMRFASTVNEALQLFAQEPADVVVSDIRMPGIDGISLFRELAREYPATARIALSGQTSEEFVLRSLGLAHQFLTKPTSVEHLRSAVDRTLSLNSLLHDPVLERVVRSVGRLPERPVVYQRVVELLDRGAVSFSEVATLFEGETVVTARILQLGNSAFFGRSRELTSVREAVSFLGLNAVRAIVLSVELFDWAGSVARLDPQFLEQLHAHSFQVAVLAARIQGEGEPGVLAFTAGVLHDIGKLVLRVAGPEALKELEGRVGHAEAGARLLAQWGLPSALVEVVAHHLQPSRVGKLVGLAPVVSVHVANALVDALETTADPAFDDQALDALARPADVASWKALAEDLRDERNSA